MASHYDTVVAYLASKLNEIADIGNVHEHYIRIEDAEARRVNFAYTLTEAPDVGTKVYRAWFIDCPGLDTELATATQTFETETWEVHGFLGYVTDPDDEKLYANRSKAAELRRAVLNKFFKNLGLYGLYLGERVFKTVGPNSTSTLTLAKFANILCWHIAITFPGTYDETF